MSNQSQEPTPELFMAAVTGYQRTAAIKGAVELGLFTAIADGAANVPAIAAKCEASERGIRILCDYLVVNGFLTKQGQDYGLTRDSAVFLNQHSPAYMGGILEFFLDPGLAAAFSDIAATVRTGTTILPPGGTVSHDNPVWVQFARAMMPMMMMPAKLMAEQIACPADKPVRILDIAAGHGIFGIAYAQRYPNAEVVALDWPNVLEVATENAAKFGVADRHSAVGGSAFEADFGGQYDIILLTNFLHHFDAATNVTLLKKVHSALADGGRAVTLEFIPNPDRVTPPWSAGFSYVMLASTSNGDAYTFAELESMFADAGFSSSAYHDLPPSMNQVVISQK